MTHQPKQVAVMSRRVATDDVDEKIAI